LWLKARCPIPRDFEFFPPHVASLGKFNVKRDQKKERRKRDSFHSPEAAFIRDVTVHDGTLVEPNQVLVKTWEMKNSGQGDWPVTTFLKAVGGSLVMESCTSPIRAKPKETVQVSVTVRVPSVPGQYNAFYRLAYKKRKPQTTSLRFNGEDESDLYEQDSQEEEIPFGGRIWMDVVVPSQALLEPQAKFLEHVTLPDENSEVKAGAEVIKVWRLRNTGSFSWPVDTFLQMQRIEVKPLEGATPVSVQMAAPIAQSSTVLPEIKKDETVEVNVQVQLPIQVGRYRCTYRLVGRGKPFGPELEMNAVIKQLPIVQSQQDEQERVEMQLVAEEEKRKEVQMMVERENRERKEKEDRVREGREREERERERRELEERERERKEQEERERKEQEERERKEQEERERKEKEERERKEKEERERKEQEERERKEQEERARKEQEERARKEQEEREKKEQEERERKEQEERERKERVRKEQEERERQRKEQERKEQERKEQAEKRRLKESESFAFAKELAQLEALGFTDRDRVVALLFEGTEKKKKGNELFHFALNKLLSL